MKKALIGTHAVITATAQRQARDPEEVVSEKEHDGIGICRTRYGGNQLAAKHFFSVDHPFYKHERHTGAGASARNIRSETLAATHGHSVAKSHVAHGNWKYPQHHEGVRIT